jgi:hypothetical protein
MGRPKGRKTNPFRKPLKFTRSDVERAGRSAQALGLAISQIEIAPDGKIVVAVIPPSSTQRDDGDAGR